MSTDNLPDGQVFPLQGTLCAGTISCKKLRVSPSHLSSDPAFAAFAALGTTNKIGDSMALSERSLTDEIHPIDIVEHIASHNEWDFDRIGDDQIAMTIEGQWRIYSITLAWSTRDETLRMVCSFEMEPPVGRMHVLHEGLNLANDQCWAGAFSYWREQKLMVWRYGLVLAGGNVASPEQIDRIIATAVNNAERYYPAFQLMSWTDKCAHDAMQIAMTDAYGRA